MMRNPKTEFEQSGKQLVEWIANYFENVETYPVKPKLKPGDIEKILPQSPPQKGTGFASIMDDFQSQLLPGITHWQHPGFHAYFPANNSEPSVLAEILMAGLGVQGMKWITSPSATELEKVVLRWLRQMLELPEFFTGVIMDTASVSTLCAVLAAREKITEYAVNEHGFEGKRLRVYCSSEAHSSVEKAVRIAGIGSSNLIKIETDEQFRMVPAKLREAIESDLKSGFVPCCVVGALGTTGCNSFDPLLEIGQLCSEFKLWFHVDAAYSGNALVLPEIRKTIKGLELASSFVFNPHKWMFTNFDCSAFFIKDTSLLTRTFSLVPAYLQTGHTDDIDYSNWGIQLGRRFRSLKLWFVIRSYGIEGIREKIRYHITLGERFEKYVIQHPDFEMVVPRSLNAICFRYRNIQREAINEFNMQLLDRINENDDIFLSHTLLNDKFVIRFVCGQTNVQERHIDKAWQLISSSAEELIKEYGNK